MRGPEGARDWLAQFLADGLPRKIPALREAYSYGDGDLPDVNTISSGEKPDNQITNMGNTWVEVVTPRLVTSRVIDLTPYGPQWANTYAMRLYVWALAPSWAESIARRDRVSGAVRALLWEFPTLTLEGGDTGARVEHAGWSEEYGTPARAGNASGRTWAAGVLSFEMIIEETNEQGALRPPIGNNERTVIGTDVVGPYEPFPDELPPDLPGPGPLLPDPQPSTTG